MEKEKRRYVAVVELYVWADNDNEAIDIAQALCKEQQRRFDNRCSLTNLVEQPFGTIGNRVVKF
jgi:hypothetical protein